MPKSRREVQVFMDWVRLASFATVDSNNRPHVVPVFFTYNNGTVYVQTDRDSVKICNILRNNNVAVAVYSGEEAVIVRGKGRVIDDEEEFIKRTQEHIAKYYLRLDKDGRDSMGIPLFDREIRCVVEVTSQRIIFW
jgi:nitroimidazol reductase NimA-like FMN-containing flavoprotein (pyridoxamine 5'-phosphate oxidase superfamily)